MKKSLQRVTFNLLTWLFVISVSAQDGPFPPPAGQPGSTAINKDSLIFESWASALAIKRGYINLSNPGEEANGSNFATFGKRSNGLGAATGNSNNVISLGDGGEVTLTFGQPIVNGPGADFAVFENGFLDTFLELAFVEVSSDGVNYFRFPAISLNSEETQIGPFGEVDATKIHNLAGKYRIGFGTPFDLSDLEEHEDLDISNIRFVRIIDVVGSVDPAYATFDSQGNMVNDPFPTPFVSGGFDLEAVGIINGGKDYLVSDFQNLELPEESFENGANINGSFTSGAFDFHNNYNAEWNSWSGWAFSNQTDDQTSGFSNQFSSFAEGGVAGGGDDYDNFAIGTIGTDWMSGSNAPVPNTIAINTDDPQIVNGLYVTNSTYAALSMTFGDAFAKKFGGISGDDPDWFKLIIWGSRQNGSFTDSVEFYLADFRFEDNSLDYIVKDWSWVDLAHLGEITALNFILLSSDVGGFGMNTPSYFCIDNITVEQKDISPVLITEIPDFTLYLEENPSISVDLSDYFEDGDDDFSNFKFAITSNSDVSVASISFSGGIMTIHGLKDGTSDLILTGQSNAFALESSFSVTVLQSTTVQTFSEIGVSIYPNPFVDELKIEGLGNYLVRVFTNTGQLVYSEENRIRSNSLSLSHLAPGIYILEMIGEGKTAIGKVVKQ